jgi:hypothetical protein
MQVRFRLRKNERKVYLCHGHNNSCTKEVKEDGLCRGCISGRSALEFKKYADGETFTINGTRYKRVGTQARKLCVGDNNTCKSFRKAKSDQCDGHINNTKKYGTEGLVVGEIVERNGERRKFNGIQLVKLCSHKGCDITSTKNGRCKKHSPHWHCRFSEEPCTSIRVNKTPYCAIHKGNVQNPRVKSQGEKLISEYLDSQNIKYACNSAIVFDNKTIYPDFILTDYNAAIEYDGKQHFESVNYWNGDAGLLHRRICDNRKDRWAQENTKGLLRISAVDKNNFVDYITTFLEILPDLDAKNKIVSTGYAGYANRDYVFI